MIISASRRTDIPAFYSEWFFARLKEGHALIPNPRNPNRLSRVELSPENVDCIVFWTKNPIPMLDSFEQLDEMGYRYYVQFTLTPYEKTVEANLPLKTELIKAFIKMSERKNAVVWRYDPIFIDDRHSVEWHITQFSAMCEALSSHAERCFLSFVDPYKSIGIKFRALTTDEMQAISAGFSGIARQHGITLYTCAEQIDLSGYGIAHGSCIDKNLIERIIGSSINAKNDASQRTECRCIESVDIGAYDTCPNGCAYCYAVSSQKTLLHHIDAHDPNAPMLTGYPEGNEIVTNRTTPSQKENQMSLF